MADDGELRARAGTAAERTQLIGGDAGGAPDKSETKAKTAAQRIRERDARSRGSGSFQCTLVSSLLLLGGVAMGLLLYYMESQAQIPGLCNKTGEPAKAKEELERALKLLAVLRGCGWCWLAYLFSAGLAAAYGMPTPPVILSDFGAPAPWPEQPEQGGTAARLKGREADRWAMFAASEQRQSAVRDLWRPLLQAAQAAAVLGAGVWAAVAGVPVVGVYAGSTLVSDGTVAQQCRPVPYLTGVALSAGSLLLSLLYAAVLAYFGLRSLCRAACPGFAASVYKTELEDELEIERVRVAQAKQARDAAEAERAAEAAEAGRSGAGISAGFGAYSPAFPSPAGAGVPLGEEAAAASVATSSSPPRRGAAAGSASMQAVAEVAAGAVEAAAAAAAAPTSLAVPGLPQPSEESPPQ